MIAAALFGALLWWRGTPVRHALVPAYRSQTWWVGFVAVIAGWVVTESGRQPWLVQGILRTADAISPVPAASIAATLALFVVVYGIVFAMGIYLHQPADRAGARTQRGAEAEAGRAARSPRTPAREAMPRRELNMEWFLAVIWAG